MFRLSSRLGAKAPTIGVIVDRLGDPYQANICHGIEQGAAQAGANLLLFVGGTLQAGSSEAGRQLAAETDTWRRFSAAVDAVLAVN